MHRQGRIDDDKFNYGIWQVLGIPPDQAMQITRFREDMSPGRVSRRERWEVFVVTTLSTWAEGITALLKVLVAWVERLSAERGGAAGAAAPAAEV